MDVRVTDKRIETLKWRVQCDLAKLPEDFYPWGQYIGGLMAYLDSERDEIVAYLKAAKIAYTVTAEPQPNPDLLAKLQGRVNSRSEALAALQTQVVPPTLGDIEQLKARITALEAKSVI